MKIIVTGGAGFIGSALLRYLITETDHSVLNIDALTYAGNLNSLLAVRDNPRYSFQQINICDREAVTEAVKDFQPNIIMHLAAESHVDRSIDGPAEFLQTNIIGTFTLLEVAREYYFKLNADDRASFRFQHISTDEVYGDLRGEGGFFTESNAYKPSSPYSASKASSDHLVRAWAATYDLPILLSACSNNYGPFQFPEKLIPLAIQNALLGKPIPVYGNGEQIRDWLYVDDHVKALCEIFAKGVVGETYNIGGSNEVRNIDVVKQICLLMEELRPEKPAGIGRYQDLITFVEDRPGHDVRYAIDASKIHKALSWQAKETFDTGLKKTVQWYLENQAWTQQVLDGSYQLQRIGISKEANQ